MIAIVAFGVIDALGEGAAALGVEGPAQTTVRRDAELDAAGLTRPFCARAAIATDRDRAAVLLERALASCASELDRALPDWRERRVGLAIGTSSGGMRCLEDASMAGTYFGPVLAAARPCAFAPFALLLGACASSTLAIGVAREWLLAGKCDLVLAGGFDATSVFVASGFEALRATCTERGPRPFRVDRDGLALGEGAAVLALARRDVGPWITGFGASCDAVHLTAPDREGGGLARAAVQALAAAGNPRVNLVSAHGTATTFNDAAEAKALATVLGDRVRDVPIHAMKGVIGHTLGAAGAIETLAAVRALERGEAPASAGSGEVEADLRILDRAEPCDARVALKLSSAFGGANAALVVTTERPSHDAPERREVYVSRAVFVSAEDAAQAAAQSGYSEDRVARADLLVRLVISAVAKLGAVRGAGIVVGHGLATYDTNHAYLAKLRASRGRGEPRRFPYTTPNAAAGECAVAFGLTGPAFAVGGGPHGGIEALAVAAELVAGKIAERIIVVAADEAGEASRRLAEGTCAGAVALLVSAEPLAARWGGSTSRLEPAAHGEVPSSMSAHTALLPLIAGRPEAIEARLPGGFANARFFWL